LIQNKEVNIEKICSEIQENILTEIKTIISLLLEFMRFDYKIMDFKNVKMLFIYLKKMIQFHLQNLKNYVENHIQELNLILIV
jgi:hypothetical protein